MSRPTPPAIAAGNQHAEAFCRMLYRSRDGMVEEWIWNSRDGVTPFCTTDRDGTTELQHVEWHRDQFLPDYQPPVGSRIFIDAWRVRDQLRPRAKAYVDRYWEPQPVEGDDIGHPGMRTFSQFGGSKDAAVEVMLNNWTEAGQPTIAEITPDGPMVRQPSE